MASLAPVPTSDQHALLQGISPPSWDHRSLPTRFDIAMTAPMEWVGTHTANPAAPNVPRDFHYIIITLHQPKAPTGEQGRRQRFSGSQPHPWD